MRGPLRVPHAIGQVVNRSICSRESPVLVWTVRRRTARHRLDYLDPVSCAGIIKDRVDFYDESGDVVMDGVRRR